MEVEDKAKTVQASEGRWSWTWELRSQQETGQSLLDLSRWSQSGPQTCTEPALGGEGLSPGRL